MERPLSSGKGPPGGGGLLPETKRANQPETTDGSGRFDDESL